MGSPRWKRLCLLLLLGLTFSVVIYGHYYYAAESSPCPRTASRLLQEKILELTQAEIPRDIRNSDVPMKSIRKWGNATQEPSRRDESNSLKEKSSLCPQSLKTKVETDPVFRKQFDFNVPTLIWKQLFTLDTWNRLNERNVPYGWRGLPYEVITSALQHLNSSRLVSKSISPDGCIHCAVVGNGGILNGSHQGKEIDAHDFVFRLNGAVTKGFEKDVGTKTSFYGFTVNTMKNSLVAYAEYGFAQIPQAKDVRYIFIPSDIRDYLMLRSAILSTPVPEGYDKGDNPQKYFGPEAFAGKFQMLHPEFVHYLKERFLKSKIINTEFGNVYMPSTGALMLLTALHTCDQVSAYGFITDNYKMFSDHYYEREKKPLVFYANHDMLLEAGLWKRLHQVGILKLYQR